MNRPSWLLANFLVFFILVLFSATLQTSFFHWVFGWRPTIQLVLVFLVYVCLHRPPVEALLFVVLSCFCTGLLSVSLVSTNVFGGVCIFVFIQGLRNRIYSPSSKHFTWTVLGSIFVFQMAVWGVGLFVGPNPPPPRPLDWTLELLLTSILTRPLYHFCVWVDKRTRRLTLAELNS